MLCQNCGENEANVRYTQIINGEKKEMVLCNYCSKELGIDHIDLNMPIDFSSFFESILGDVNYEQEFMPIITKEKELRCPFCNITYNEFVKSGKFGCSSCYDTFENKIDTILKRIHGDNRYLGRKCYTSNLNNSVGNSAGQIPPATDGDPRHLAREAKDSKEKEQSNMEKLQNELKQAIKEERYEDAAKIRDKLKKLQ